MEYITLKNSELKVSRICFGGCPMGGYGWGNVQKQELIDAVHVAIDQGITFFDTADTYGFGQSEITLGKALGSYRKELTIATKFGVRVNGGVTRYDNSPEWIKHSIEGSLKRIGTDYIDLYQLHYRDGVTPISAVLETLDILKQKGMIRYYGLSNIHHSDIPELLSFIGRFVSFQDEYSLACRKNELDILELSESLQMNPLTWGSLGQGILTGKYDISTKFKSDDRRSRGIYVNFHGEKLRKNIEIVEVMKEIAAKHHKPVSALAIRFILDFLPHSVVLCGAKRPNQVLENVEGANWNLYKDDLDRLDQISYNS